MVTRACLRYAREGQNVTQAGPKCHTSRAKMSHKGQNVTKSCYNVLLNIPKYNINSSRPKSQWIYSHMLYLSQSLPYFLSNGPLGTNFSPKCISKCSLLNVSHFVQDRMCSLILCILYQNSIVVYWYINTLWPCDAICWHTAGWTLVQVMACCVTAVRHYLN